MPALFRSSASSRLISESNSRSLTAYIHTESLNRLKPSDTADSPTQPMQGYSATQTIAAKENSRPAPQSARLNVSVSAPMPVEPTGKLAAKRSKPSNGKKAGGLDVIDTLDITGALYGAGELCLLSVVRTGSMQIGRGAS